MSERSTDPKATADQPPTEGEAYAPVVEPGGDVPGSDHEEPIDGTEPEPR